MTSPTSPKPLSSSQYRTLRRFNAVLNLLASSVLSLWAVEVLPALYSLLVAQSRGIGLLPTHNRWRKPRTHRHPTVAPKIAPDRAHVPLTGDVNMDDPDEREEFEQWLADHPELAPLPQTEDLEYADDNMQVEPATPPSPSPQPPATPRRSTRLNPEAWPQKAGPEPRPTRTRPQKASPEPAITRARPQMASPEPLPTKPRPQKARFVTEYVTRPKKASDYDDPKPRLPGSKPLHTQLAPYEKVVTFEPPPPSPTPPPAPRAVKAKPVPGKSISTQRKLLASQRANPSPERIRWRSNLITLTEGIAAEVAPRYGPARNEMCKLFARTPPDLLANFVNLVPNQPPLPYLFTISLAAQQLLVIVLEHVRTSGLKIQPLPP